jgi:hypothetical protein
VRLGPDGHRHRRQQVIIDRMDIAPPAAGLDQPGRTPRNAHQPDLAHAMHRTSTSDARTAEVAQRYGIGRGATNIPSGTSARRRRAGSPVGRNRARNRKIGIKDMETGEISYKKSPSQGRRQPSGHDA